jgi:hypothetical protein
MAILLSLPALPAGASMAMTADGEPSRFVSGTPSPTSNVSTTPLAAPMRLYVTPARRPAATAESAWCVYRITANVRPLKPSVVAPGELICMSCQDMFGPSPQSAEFRFLDPEGKDLGSAFGELMTAPCGPCALETHQRFAMYRR